MVVVDDSVLCEWTVDFLREKLDGCFFDSLEIVSFENLSVKFPFLSDFIEGFPQFFFLDEKGNKKNQKESQRLGNKIGSYTRHPCLIG